MKTKKVEAPYRLWEHRKVTDEELRLAKAIITVVKYAIGAKDVQCF